MLLRSITLWLLLGINPAANAAAVDGPPIAAFDAVSTSCQLECGQWNNLF